MHSCATHSGRLITSATVVRHPCGRGDPDAGGWQLSHGTTPTADIDRPKLWGSTCQPSMSFAGLQRHDTAGINSQPATTTTTTLFCGAPAWRRAKLQATCRPPTRGYGVPTELSDCTTQAWPNPASKGSEAAVTQQVPSGKWIARGTRCCQLLASAVAEAEHSAHTVGPSPHSACRRHTHTHNTNTGAQRPQQSTPKQCLTRQQQGPRARGCYQHSCRCASTHTTMNTAGFAVPPPFHPTQPKADGTVQEGLKGSSDSTCNKNSPVG